MNKKPIIFSGEMVRAILDGRKTVTRRVIQPQPPDSCIIGKVNQGYGTWWIEPTGSLWPEDKPLKSPFGKAGDRLWVRETFVIEQSETKPTDGRPFEVMTEEEEEWAYFGPYRVPHYRATETEPHIVPLDLKDGLDDRTRWRPSIHMPRWVSRISLEILNVRVSKLQAINQQQIIDEGVTISIEDWEKKWYDKKRDRGLNIYLATFIDLWNSLNEKRGFAFDTNPWVWIYHLRRIIE